MRALTAGMLLLLIVTPGVLSQEKSILIHGSGTQPRSRGQTDLVIVPVDGSDLIRLTDSRMIEGDAEWSSDGTRVVFTGATGRMNDLFVVNIDGSGLVNITNTPEIGEGDASWSPDSRRIVFSAGTWTVYKRPTGTSRAIDTMNIYTMNADGSDLRQLTDDSSKNYDPKFSRDGRSIAFASSRAGLPEIYVVNADGSNPRRITESPEGIYCDQPSWSPGGVQIAYTRHEGHLSDIYVSNADASRAFQITDTPEIESEPAWSPSGIWIAFCSQLRSAAQVYRVRPNGQDTVRITTLTESHFTGPSWSPDETFLVAQTRIRSEIRRPSTAYTLWDSGGISIQAAGDEPSRFIGATRHPDDSVTTRSLSEVEGRAWFQRHGIPFPELREH